MSENPKIYVADKETLDKVYAILATDPVYGFIEHCAIKAPGERIEYIGLNKNFKPLVVTMGGGYALNDWADFPWLKGNKPYMVNEDGTPAYRLKEDDYSKKEDGTPSDVANSNFAGDAMAWAPKIYKREYMAGDDRYVMFRYDPAPGFEATGFMDDDKELEGVWMPMFYGATTGEPDEEKMRSISDTQPQHTVNTDKQKTAIEKVGSQARFFGGAIINTLVDLMIMFAKTTNLQAAYGMGNCNGYDASQSPTMGVKRNAVVSGGQFYGTSDTKTLNKIFHSIVLGSYNIWIRDPYTLLVNGRYKVSPGYKIDLTGTTYQDTGITIPKITKDDGSQNTGIFYPHKYQTVPHFGALPVPPYEGSTTTGGCDGLWQNVEITAVALRFGSCNGGANAGGRSWNVGNAAADASWGFGSALLLLPPVGVAV